MSEPVEHIITVFTPTFNRAQTLSRVYDSLHLQSFRDFEWLIVDDGSTDDTRALIDQWQSEAGFSIRYLHQENAGKHVAVNRGVAAAHGRFFLILDSDDECVPEALERFLFHWQSIPEAEKPRFSGVTCLCEDEHGRLVGSPFPHSPCDSDSIEIRLRYKVKGEKWGFQRTDVMRLFPFPEVRGERFVTESLVWRAIGRRFRTRYVNESLRIYHTPQVTSTTNLSRTKVADRAEGSRQNCEAMLNHDLRWFYVSPRDFIRTAANYSRCSMHRGLDLRTQFRRLTNLFARILWIGALPVGWLLFQRDQRRS